MKQIGTPVCVPASVSASAVARGQAENPNLKISENDRRSNKEEIKQGTMAEVKFEGRNTC